MPERIVLDGSELIDGYPEIKQIEVRFDKRRIIHTPQSLWELIKWAYSQGAEEVKE